MDNEKRKHGEPGVEDDEAPEIVDDRNIDDFELEHDDAEPDDRRRDPLRKP